MAESIKTILDRIEENLRSAKSLNMKYFNVELQKLSESLEQTGGKELELNEAGALLHTILIIESKFRRKNLRSHLLKSIKQFVYKNL